MDDATSSQEEVKKTLPPKQTFLSLSWDYFKFLLTCASIYGVGYFRLSVSWVLLGSLGYFVIRHTKNKNSKLISSLKAIGEDEKAFIIQNFSVRDLPSWVYFPDVERAEWLNKPPRIGGIKVYMNENIRKDEIVLDLDLMLYSDARIKVNLGKVKAGVKEFELRGTLRVVMKPLVPKVPFAGAVTVCFLDRPVSMLV
ncbi:unnamed protein product [Trichobilharzia szidati]|nr:unnamed protein product [Trichobilharzia szidati]